MRISLDGGVTFQEVTQDVVLDIDLQTDDAPTQSATIRFTAEGMIADLWADGEVGECEETVGVEYCDLANYLFYPESK
jgi:hypothetical protein